MKSANIPFITLLRVFEKDISNTPNDAERYAIALEDWLASHNAKFSKNGRVEFEDDADYIVFKLKYEI